ncbi:RagB/SusD family nutrient uptake outer membrane protein [Tamlana sp. 2201CG12-4]|nr:RagB/SusD family nutrient uptake outer membrane protein [Tamlana sp. 2201CG12-4]MEC3908232.1 RagB/SusD family nutrient uptake outer membrane protein [Tamlana sp. 2201CG12-4]
MKKLILITLFSFVLCSCNDEFLEENPSGIFTAENLYTTSTHFQSALNQLYSDYRGAFYIGSEEHCFGYQYGTDFGLNGQVRSVERFGNYVSQLDPTAGTASWNWTRHYQMIAHANTILSRLEGSALDESESVLVEAEAKFFRGAAYRALTYLYGGVPLVLEEVSGPKTDFVRNTKAECLAQIIADLEFSAANLPDITEVADGKVSSAAANHLLAEVCISVGDFNKAVTASSEVINNPGLALMKSRFGSRKSEPGDVYWDLFRRDNQNRGAGNTEGVFVIQWEIDVPGGGSLSTTRDGSYKAERVHPPLTRDIKRLDNASSKARFRWPVSDYTGGRGIGWLKPTYHFTHTIWMDDMGNLDLNDIRNSQYNLPRYYEYNNPNGSYPLGTIFDIDTNPEVVASITNTGDWPRSMYPYQTKVTTPGNHPEGIINPANGLIYGTGGGTYTDWYDMRLAETYLIRAEAYLGLGQTDQAAQDINVVRDRANAVPIDASDVDIDFILDERLRELGIEEKRRLTLVRLGKLHERVVKYNPLNKDDIQPHHELFPIPRGEIEANIGAVLEQNPGYIN